MKKILFFLILPALSGVISAQNLSYDFYSFRNGNMFNVNPAFCSKEEGINLILNAQSQNAGVSYANKNFMAGAHSKIDAKQGIGLKLVSDSRGAFQILKADISYSYIARFSETHKLSMGLSGGIYNSNLSTGRIDNYELLDQTDPTLSDNQFNSTQFIAGAGVLYTYKDLEVSLSAPHIIATSQHLISYTHTAVFYTKKINDKFKIQPWLCYENIPVTKNITSILAKGFYKDLLWMQAGYQTNNSIMASFGVKVDNIGISYGFKSSNKDFRQIAGGIHEVVFTVRMGAKAGVGTRKVTELEDVITSLDKLLGKTINAETRAEIRIELEKLKIQLKNLEVDNSNPEKAKKVEEQLGIIDQKMKTLEKRLSDE